ncbi:hypothetical protein U0035_21525 [Niabella yanshanensis]|uniref:Uncharacterized protein n=1 Tax=Niabella yanshanensis TaxID=577386 RepID=A0ABZ0W4R7_9BACT|nr:hypothetical protein [Niabella yanshanensis]WQD38255.1 hypothetical protein U0035_21525 [Niabella yanshanensis]
MNLKKNKKFFKFLNPWTMKTAPGSSKTTYNLNAGCRSHHLNAGLPAARASSSFPAIQAKEWLQCI